MHAAGIARKRYGPGDLERCRLKLNLKLRKMLSADVIARAIVVYDAFESVSDDARLASDTGLTILFAPQGCDADGEIERLLKSHSAPKQVVVVSSDHRLHKAARRRKARCVDSEEFLAGVELPDNSAASAPATSPAIPVDSTRDAGSLMKELEDRMKQLDTLETPDSADGLPFDDSYLRGLEQDLNEGNLS